MMTKKKQIALLREALAEQRRLLLVIRRDGVEALSISDLGALGACVRMIGGDFNYPPKLTSDGTPDYMRALAALRQKPQRTLW